jgi:outer membrane protein assembly factor BamB
MNVMRSLILILVLATVVSASEIDSKKLGNWPHWRGPLANGIAPDAKPPLKWDAKTNIKWKVELPGRGSATPIVWGNQVFVVTAIKTDRVAKDEDIPQIEGKFEKKTDAPKVYYQFVVLAYDRETGKLLWKQVAAERVPHEGHHVTHSYAAGSPTTDGKLLYVSFGSFGIYAYDLTGKLQWQRDFGRLNTRLGWGEAVSPVVKNGTLLLNWDQEAGSKLIALDAKTGETRWEVARGMEKTTWSTPLVVEHAGKFQVIANGTDKVKAYDLADGKLIWEVGGMTTNPIPSPVADEQTIYALSGYRGAAAVAVPIGSQGDLADASKVNWRYSKGTPYVPSPLLYDGKLYFTKGNTQLLTILDAKTGQPKVDQERLPGAKDFYASPAIGNGQIYWVDRTGTTVVTKATDKLEVLATNKLEDPIDASPVLVGKQLFLRGEKYLYCIEE